MEDLVLAPRVDRRAHHPIDHQMDPRARQAPLDRHRGRPGTHRHDDGRRRKWRRQWIDPLICGRRGRAAAELLDPDDIVGDEGEPRPANPVGVAGTFQSDKGRPE